MFDYEYYNSTEYKHFMNEVDMLIGCINRICVTDSIDECDSLYESAKKTFERIYNYRKGVLSERAKHETN